MLRLNRRNFIKNTSLITLSCCFSQTLIMKALANNPLKVYSVNVAKVTNSWNEMLSVKERLAIEIKQIVENNKASFAFPSQSIYVEKK